MPNTPEAIQNMENMENSDHIRDTTEMVSPEPFQQGPQQPAKDQGVSMRPGPHPWGYSTPGYSSLMVYHAGVADAFMDHQAALLAQKDAEIAELRESLMLRNAVCESLKDMRDEAKTALRSCEKELREKAETRCSSAWADGYAQAVADGKAEDERLASEELAALRTRVDYLARIDAEMRIDFAQREIEKMKVFV